ncbi:MAG: TIGR02281 family clan AA aspartic protease [Cypionkella sp.]|nr:TIGR02281 family clan AA aspartic protease [Cypionkella sp.]
MTSDNTASLIYLALLLAALGGWALVEYRARLGEMARVAAAWGLIFLAVAAGYGLWADLRRDILPIQSVQAGRVMIPRAQDGHYYLSLQINNVPITMMADTGASGIVLSKSDATKIGIDVEGLRFLGTAMTANGEVRTARTTLDSITLGPFSDSKVTAYVNAGEMSGSLLGMDYLGRFDIALGGDEMQLSR